MSKTWKWQGSDAQRRSLCRMSFVLFVLLPTFLVAGWIVIPDRHGAWEKKLAHSCNLQVRLGRLTTLTPQHTLLSGVTWLDQDLGGIATADTLRVSELDDRTVYTIERAEIRLSELSLVLDRIQAAAIRHAGCLELPLEIVVKQLTLLSDPSDQQTPFTFDRVHIELTQKSQQSQLTARLYPAGTLDQSPIQLTLERRLSAIASDHPSSNQSQNKLRPTTFGSIDTQDHSLPLALLYPWWQSLGTLGDECEFQGRAHWKRGQQTWDAELAGSLSPVDLTRLVADRFPRRLSGQAQIDMTDFRIVDGNVEVLAGRIQCSQGQIGQPFLKSLQDELGLVAVAEEASAPVPFHSLDIRFELQGRLLDIAATNSAGYLMMDSSGYPLLAEGSDLPLRPQDLVRALVGDSQIQVPLTRETSQVFPWLPLPDVDDLTPAANRPPRAILRMED